jgi:hypothetical protein
MQPGSGVVGRCIGLSIIVAAQARAATLTVSQQSYLDACPVLVGLAVVSCPQCVGNAALYSMDAQFYIVLSVPIGPPSIRSPYLDWTQVFLINIGQTIWLVPFTHSACGRCQAPSQPRGWPATAPPAAVR